MIELLVRSEFVRKEHLPSQGEPSRPDVAEPSLWRNLALVQHLPQFANPMASTLNTSTVDSPDRPKITQ